MQDNEEEMALRIKSMKDKLRKQMDSYNERQERNNTESNEYSDSERFTNNVGSFGSKPNVEVFAENSHISRPDSNQENFETSSFRKPGRIVK